VSRSNKTPLPFGEAAFLFVRCWFDAAGASLIVSTDWRCIYVARGTARPSFVKAHADQLAHFAAAD
jgi:hypothetical protein